jgi:site-specific DNA-methyltransferase (adenine-specific)
MMIEAHATLEWIGLGSLTTSIQPRSIRETSVVRLVESMGRTGFLPQFPIVVSVLEDGYRLLAGHHRVEAARRREIERIPALLYSDLTSDDEWRIAVETNRAHEAATLPTFVDDAELVWKLAETGKNQETIATIMGWSRGQVSQYAMLKQICPDAWRMIATTFVDNGSRGSEEEVAENATMVASPFQERILREIVTLTAPQQLELVKLLLKDPKAKADYRKRAERYKARNALLDEAQRELKHVSPDLLQRALTEMEKGHYDAEWLAQKQPGERFRKLIAQLLDEHAQKQNYTLYQARFQDIHDPIPPESLDWIITDPPYGQDALPLYEDLAAWAHQKLKPGGNLAVLCGQSYLPTLCHLLSTHLTFHWCLAYLTPGGQAVHLWQRNVNSFWKPVLWFVKGTSDLWCVGDVARSAVNDNDKTLHQWGQSESGMLDLVERLTAQGETICDPCMGAGTTGVAALTLGRKFIGIESEEETYATAEKRLRTLQQPTR